MTKIEEMLKQLNGDIPQIKSGVLRAISFELYGMSLFCFTLFFFMAYQLPYFFTLNARPELLPHISTVFWVSVVVSAILFINSIGLYFQKKSFAHLLLLLFIVFQLLWSFLLLKRWLDGFYFLLDFLGYGGGTLLLFLFSLHLYQTLIKEEQVMSKKFVYAIALFCFAFWAVFFSKVIFYMFNSTLNFICGIVFIFLGISLFFLFKRTFLLSEPEEMLLELEALPD
ncbi:hypothetical protein ACFL35_07960 [Candidatus Riflebacteria bacterium]